jgi:hypothetical protein
MGKKLSTKKGKSRKGAKKETKEGEKKVIDFGLASKSHLIKKAKTHKGRKYLESKEPQLVEGKKQAIFVKGLKASGTL